MTILRNAATQRPYLQPSFQPCTKLYRKTHPPLSFYLQKKFVFTLAFRGRVSGNQKIYSTGAGSVSLHVCMKWCPWQRRRAIYCIVMVGLSDGTGGTLNFVFLITLFVGFELVSMTLVHSTALGLRSGGKLSTQNRAKHSIFFFS